MTTPVRLRPGAVLHLAWPTGRGYYAACGRTLRGPNLEIPRRRHWVLAWRHEPVCKRCDGRATRARTDRELQTLAGFRPNG